MLDFLLLFGLALHFNHTTIVIKFQYFCEQKCLFICWLRHLDWPKMYTIDSVCTIKYSKNKWWKMDWLSSTCTKSTAMYVNSRAHKSKAIRFDLLYFLYIPHWRDVYIVLIPFFSFSFISFVLLRLFVCLFGVFSLTIRADLIDNWRFECERKTFLSF